jgi:hypothetical protein
VASLGGVGFPVPFRIPSEGSRALNASYFGGVAIRVVAMLGVRFTMSGWYPEAYLCQVWRLLASSRR